MFFGGKTKREEVKRVTRRTDLNGRRLKESRVIRTRHTALCFNLRISNAAKGKIVHQISTGRICTALKMEINKVVTESTRKVRRHTDSV